MKITKAIYFHTYPNPTTGQWIKIGLEAELYEGDDYKKCLYKLRDNVRDFFYESNKAAEKQLQEVKQNEEIGLIPAINGCTDKAVLETFKLLTRNNPDAIEAYRKKLIELS